MTDLRIGSGYDVHQLAQGRELWLGGVLIPHEKGLLGHSDADVLLHAITDAILGALAMGDIGMHFPDTDPRWKGADSKVLLKEVVAKVNAAGWRIGNVDSTVVMERPKLRPHIDTMRAAIAPLLGIPVDSVSVKATTNEKMGFAGREEGVLAQAVVLMVRK